MDLTMQMKSAELLLNFIKHDTEKIPLYGFMLQKQRFVPSTGGLSAKAGSAYAAQGRTILRT